MESGKTLSSSPLTGTPKLQLFTEQPFMKKTGTYQKSSSTTKDIKRNHNEMGRRVGLTIKVSQVGDPRMGK